MTVLRRADNLPLPPLPAQPTDVPWPTTEWPTGDPWPGAMPRLDDLLGSAFGVNPHPDLGISLATVVVHEGHIVAERYGPEIERSTPLISWSMAKSVLHALVGIAVGDELFDETGTVDAPEWQAGDDERAAITIDDMLRMASGLEFVEDYVDDTTSHCLAMLFGDGRSDMASYAADRPLIAEPLTVFNYSSGTSNILSRLLASQVGSGEAFSDWANERLFAPLGMGAVTLDFDERGTWVGSSYVHATTRDYARFGLLYLRDGVWDGQRLLPPGWVDGARSRLAIDPENGRGYGRHWWIWSDAVFAAQGYETQRIVIDPTRDVVVVRLGKTPSELGPNVDAWILEIINCF